MLTQEYIRTHGLQALQDNLKVQAVQHPTLPLTILNYDQILTPKADLVARECRGLVLETGTWNLVARSFNRFFNLGEMQHEAKSFNWNNFTTTTKEDGSLVLIYNYNGQWLANTRGSFAQDKVNRETTLTWQDIIWPQINTNTLDPKLTYVAELQTPTNQVTLKVHKPNLFLLTTFDKETELPESNTDVIAKEINLPRTNKLHFKTEKEVKDYVQNVTDLIEGVVIRDDQNNRWKLKTKRFWGLHHMDDHENQNERIFPFIMDDRGDELFTYFPNLKDKFGNMRDKVLEEWTKLRNAYEQTKDITDQREFAKQVVPMTKFNSLLFIMRKNKQNSLQELEKLWKDNDNLVFKLLFK